MTTTERTFTKEEQKDILETELITDGVEDYHWWLRDAEGLMPYEAFMVCNSLNSEEYMSETVGLEGYGIRSAMTIRTDSKCIQRK